MTDIKKVQEYIEVECDCIKELLLDKNLKYGNSALEPMRIFSKADTLEQLRVRIDDKLNRIKNNKNDDEDAELDLIGYLILKRVAEAIKDEEYVDMESQYDVKTKADKVTFDIPFGHTVYNFYNKEYS